MLLHTRISAPRSATIRVDVRVVGRCRVVGARMALRRLLHGSVLPRVSGRAFAPAVAPFSTEAGETVRATLFPGDGIGPEIAESVKQVQNFVSLWFCCAL